MAGALVAGPAAAGLAVVGAEVVDGVEGAVGADGADGARVERDGAAGLLVPLVRCAGAAPVIGAGTARRTSAAGWMSEDRRQSRGSRRTVGADVAGAAVGVALLGDVAEMPGEVVVGATVVEDDVVEDVVVEEVVAEEAAALAAAAPPRAAAAEAPGRGNARRTSVAGRMSEAESQSRGSRCPVVGSAAAVVVGAAAAGSRRRVRAGESAAWRWTTLVAAHACRRAAAGETEAASPTRRDAAGVTVSVGRTPLGSAGDDVDAARAGDVGGWAEAGLDAEVEVGAGAGADAVPGAASRRSVRAGDSAAWRCTTLVAAHACRRTVAAEGVGVSPAISPGPAGATGSAGRTELRRVSGVGSVPGGRCRSAVGSPGVGTEVEVEDAGVAGVRRTSAPNRDRSDRSCHGARTARRTATGDEPAIDPGAETVAEPPLPGAAPTGADAVGDWPGDAGSVDVGLAVGPRSVGASPAGADAPGVDWRGARVDLRTDGGRDVADWAGADGGGCGR